MTEATGTTLPGGRPGRRRLGIVWPDDGRPGPDYELLRLPSWLARHGVAGVDVSVALSRAGRFHTREDLLVTGAADNLAPAARALREAGCDAIVWACTSGSFIGGLQWARQQVRVLEDAAGVPCSSTTLAFLEAARRMGISAVDVLGAYPEPVTRALAGCLAEAGIEVGAVAWLDAPEAASSFGIPLPGEALAFAARHPESRRLLLVPDTAINSLDLVNTLERALGRPVLTANQVTLWQGLHMLHQPRPRPAPGLLFTQAPPGTGAQAVAARPDGARECTSIVEPTAAFRRRRTKGMKTAIVNLGTIVTGSWREPFADADALVMAEGKITHVGAASDEALRDCDVIIDADGATAVPGFIDSQVHNTFGDYTPRQRTVGFLESYVHGGVTTGISASEVHVPGRPKDPEGVKALAVAAMKCFEHYRPGGMRYHAGSIILEPGLKEEDFAEIAAKGVWLAKAGFGAVETPYDYAPMVAWAKQHGMITTVHTGGASIPGSSAITGDHLLAIQPHVSFHVNGGPVAMPDADFERVITESKIALQLCTAGNIRTQILCSELARSHDQFDRLLIATDTPTGSGIMPLGMMYVIVNLSALTDIPPEWYISAATGNNADVYGLNSGYLHEGRDADVLIVDAPLGGTQDTALAAMKHGDICAIGSVITDGVPRFVGRSRNTPPCTRRVRVAESRVVQDFSGAGH